MISVTPLSHYDVYSYSGTEVKIDRQYLEDYASLKGCAVVAVFFEERRCSSDGELEEILDGREIVERSLPGRDLVVRRHEYYSETPILCQIWGCRLVLVPSGRPISEERKPELVWPGIPGVVTRSRVRAIGLPSRVYISDQVLEKFEGRPEYSIHPEFGSVSYDGRWSLSNCRRVARDYIAHDIKKMYEGCPPTIIRNAHRFAVPRDVVERQTQDLGDQNIGKRASSLIKAFLSVGAGLALFGNRFGGTLRDEDVISLSEQRVDYHGWWTINSLAPLGHRAALNMTKAQFLERCKTVYQLFEGLKERPLRRILTQIGLENSQLSGFRSLKLLATLLQLCEVSLETGLDIAGQRAEIVDRWDQNVQLEYLRPLFALVDLRNVAGHNLGTQEDEKIAAALEVFGLQEDSMSAGWGLALDRVYDRMIETLDEIAARLRFSGVDS